MTGYIPAVLVYALRQGKVLVMHRNKEPNLGLWTAPGGKIELTESPHDTARREMVEETGLEVENLFLRGLCTQVSSSPDWQWMQFIFVTTRFHGTLKADPREGDLAWVSLEEYFTALPTPQADAIFAPRVLTMDEGCFQAKFVYDDRLELMEWVEY
ncbi:MAG: NUDIX domain-containing protein [Chloroflexota bacterium]|nr:NUDIX domain-containing protein [Chloroflexota bacterium]